MCFPPASFLWLEISPNLVLALMTKEFPHLYRKQPGPTFQNLSLLSISCLSLALHHLSFHPYSASSRLSCSWYSVIHVGIRGDNLFIRGIHAECPPSSQHFPSRWRKVWMKTQCLYPCAGESPLGNTDGLSLCKNCH